MSRFRPASISSGSPAHDRGRQLVRLEPAQSQSDIHRIAIASQSSKYGQAHSDSANLDELFVRLWRSRIPLLTGALAGALVVVLLSSLLKPVYRARTTIRLKDFNEQSQNLPQTLTPEPIAPDETYLQNELKVLESDSLAKRVALQLGLKPVRHPSSFTSWTPFANLSFSSRQPNRQPSWDDLLINEVRLALTVRPSLKSQVIELSFDSADPVLAARGANTVVSEYIAMNREERIQTSRDTTEWLTEQTSDLKRKLDKGNEELQAFARSSGLLYGSNQNFLIEDRARQVQEALSKARAERALKQSIFETAMSHPPEALPSSADSGLLRDYEAKLAAVQAELIQLRALYTPAHYKLAEAEARTAQLESAIKTERQRILEGMRTEYTAAERLEGSLEKTYDAQKREVIQQTEAAFRYSVLKRDLDSTELLYNSLSQKAKEAGVTSAMRTVSVSVIDSARPPTKPRSPNLPLNGSLGFSAGLIFAGGMVLIRNRDAYLSARIEDTSHLAVRELGTIPLARRIASSRRPIGLFAPEEKTTGVELVAWYEQPSFLTEAFRATVISIVFSPLLERHKNLVLTVTSVHPQEGKTTAVSNLGIALAETHKRVLLIDADLRRPRIHEIFGHCNDSGLSTVLGGDEPVPTLNLDTLIRETNVPGLFTLSSGPGTPSIPTLLYSARFSAFLARVRKEFDYILIDTPPVSLFSDARILGRFSDGLIMVVHAAKATRSEVNETCANFLKDGTLVVGTIVNRPGVRPRGYESYRQTPV